MTNVQLIELSRLTILGNFSVLNFVFHNYISQLCATGAVVFITGSQYLPRWSFDWITKNYPRKI